jgi:hypothetical protein
MLALRGGRLMRHAPYVAQQPDVLPCGQGQHDRKDTDSIHGFSPSLLVARNGPSRSIHGPFKCGRFRLPCALVAGNFLQYR